MKNLRHWTPCSQPKYTNICQKLRNTRDRENWIRSVTDTLCQDLIQMKLKIQMKIKMKLILETENS